MNEKSLRHNRDGRVTRRTFLGTTLVTGAALLARGSDVIFGAESSASPNIATNPTWQLGGDLRINRLGFGAMRITGEGIWGWPPDRGNALKVLRRAVELGVDLIDTADAYGPETSELLIAEAPLSLSQRFGYCDERRLNSTGTGPVGAGWNTPTSQTSCGREPKAPPPGANRCVSAAPCRSQSAHGGIAWRH